MASRKPGPEEGSFRGSARYLHIKDLQAKAQAEARELGPHIPVDLHKNILCCSGYAKI